MIKELDDLYQSKEENIKELKKLQLNLNS